MDAAQRALYGKFHPLILKALKGIIVPILAETTTRHARNWEFEFAEKMDRALTRLAARIEGSPGNDTELMEQGINPGVVRELLMFRDIVCTLASQERYYFPKWWTWLIEELRRENLITPP